MLPPPPASRQASYAYSLPRHSRNASHTHTYRSRSSAEVDDMDEDDAALAEELEQQREQDEARGLEETLEKLGFGSYHWRLLALCGFGWMSDNSALQCVAVILPRVQIHFDLSAKFVGLLSTSTMAGMMVGAVSWGTASDLLGRALPFNATLFLTAIFGICASYSPSFLVLCIWMFFLGSAVGGSMPTDGTLFLENLPRSKQYLLTLLSIFFSLGAVLSSVVSYYYLPGASCSHFQGCDIDNKENDGWRRVLFALGCFNLICALARWFLFRLHESPRYLVTNGREQEALVALRAIATYNRQSIDINCEDIQLDRDPSSPINTTRRGYDKKDSEVSSPIPGGGLDERIPFPKYDPESNAPGTEGGISPSQNSGSGSGSGSNSTKYDSVGVGLPPIKKYPVRLGSAFYTAPSPVDSRHSTNTFEAAFTHARISGEGTGKIPDEEQGLVISGGDHGVEDEGTEDLKESGKRHDATRIDRSGAGSSWLSRPIDWWIGWRIQLGKLFVPKWRRTVILMWVIWGSMAFSYTMFNVWLPAVLEDRAQGEGDEAIRYALKEFVLYSMAGCPGSIVGAWMIQTKLGRRKSLAICTAATGLSTFAFIRVQSDWAVIVSSMIISAAATAMYAVLYGMTPETFGTSIRGTACGTSAALSRLLGMAAPVTAGFLITFSASLPVFTSATILFLTAACSLALPFEQVLEGKGGGGAFVH